jgi:hypothetical protein
MSGNLSPAATQKLAILHEFVARVQRIHGLVEQFAAAKTKHEELAMPIRRAFQRLKIQLMTAGYDTQAQLCGSMEIAANRGASAVQKARILREGVGQLRFQLELEQRAVVTEDRAAQQKEAAGG